MCASRSSPKKSIGCAYIPHKNSKLRFRLPERRGTRIKAPTKLPLNLPRASHPARQSTEARRNEYGEKSSANRRKRGAENLLNKNEDEKRVFITTRRAGANGRRHSRVPSGLASVGAGWGAAGPSKGWGGDVLRFFFWRKGRRQKQAHDGEGWELSNKRPGFRLGERKGRKIGGELESAGVLQEGRVGESGGTRRELPGGSAGFPIRRGDRSRAEDFARA